MVQASYLVNYSKLGQTKLVLQKITTLLLLAGSLTGSAVKTCCAINGQPQRETAGNTDKLEGGGPVLNQVSYALTGFVNLYPDSWTRVSINVEMTGSVFNYLFEWLAGRLKQLQSENQSDYQIIAEKFFQVLSGKNTDSKVLVKEWNPFIKNKFDKMEHDIVAKIGVSIDNLWNWFWQNEQDAGYFIKIFMWKTPNPLYNWWIKKKDEKQQARNYLVACRTYGADFNLKFERKSIHGNFYIWNEYNSYLIVAQDRMPTTIKEIWYDYDLETGEEVAPVVYLYIFNPEGYQKIQQLLTEILKEFGRWLTGKNLSKYSFKLDASDQKKEFNYDVPTHLTFRFHYAERGKQMTIPDTKQEVKAIFHKRNLGWQSHKTD